MDLHNASAMTEASGLGNAPPADATTSALEMASRESLLRTADLVRNITRAAPLSSLAVAFMAGVLLARRR